MTPGPTVPFAPWRDPTVRRALQEVVVRIGIPREAWPGESLVAATAKTAEQLVKLGYDVVVESGAGGSWMLARWPG